MQTLAPHILIVDDDPQVGETLSLFLKQRAYQVTTFTETATLMDFLETTPVTLLVIDLFMPSVNGLLLSQQIKARHKLPIIMLSGADEDESKIVALETHVDDYLTKPFNPRVLAARIGALLRRKRSTANTSSVYHFAGWQFDTVTGTLLTPGREKAVLSVQLVTLLKIFVARPGYVYSREDLLEALRGQSTSFEERRVDSLVNQLRLVFQTHDLKNSFIQTVRLKGYRFNA